MATECPDCGQWYKGKSCKCGGTIWKAETATPRASCRECGMPAVTLIDRKPVCRDHYDKHWVDEAKGASEGIDWKTVKNKLTFADPGRKWAENIISDYENNLYGNEYGYRLACSAMKKVAVVKETEEF